VKIRIEANFPKVKLLLSEALPEPDDTPASMLASGFLPSLPDLSRWYLCRQVRVELPAFSPTSENRRILRKGAGLSCTLLERSAFGFDPPRLEFCHGCACRRWSRPPPRERIERIFASPLTSHVALFRRPDGSDAGIVTLLRDGGTWFYSNAFHDPEAPPGTGAFLMTETVRMLARDGQGFLHLGTCYSRPSLYKVQFPGVRFFDGNRWCADVKALKHLISRQEGAPEGHLLEDPRFLEAWVPEGTTALAAASPLRLGA
jgi:hypothetical protein